MGFGYIFIGYFFMIFYPVSSVGLLPNASVIGCFIMWAGMGRLLHYCPGYIGFVRARKALIPLSVISAAAFVPDIIELFTPLSESFNNYYSHGTGALASAALCVFSVLLFVGIYKLANDVELPKLASAASARITLTAVFTLADIISAMCSLLILLGAVSGEGFVAVSAYLGLFAFLFEYVCIFFNLWLLFKCYSLICLEGDEDMPYREDIFDKILSVINKNKQ